MIKIRRELVGVVCVVVLLTVPAESSLGEIGMESGDVVEIVEWESAVEVGIDVAYTMGTEVGELGHSVAMSVMCDRSGMFDNGVVVFFGAFPEDGRDVQLFVREENGNTIYFGGPVSMESGYRSHNPGISAHDDAVHFAEVALRFGSLVANGYRSFVNRISAARNMQVRKEFIACLEDSWGE